MPDGLFATITDLAKAGFAGVGIIVFLLLFILLLRGRPIDAPSAKLYNRFLTWGVSFAAFCGLLTIVTLFAQPTLVPAGPQKLTMTFAPDFQTEKLPVPRIKLSDGRTVAPDTEFTWPGGMINVSVGDAFNEIRSLKSTVGEYGQAIATLREQRDTLAKTLSEKTSPSPSAAATIDEASAASVVLQGEVKAAIASGDFSRAAIASKRLNSPRIMAPAAVGTLVRNR